MDLQDALAQIAEIRAHIAQNETFRGFRSATVAASGLLALLGAAMQALWIPDPQQQLAAYVRLWIVVATVSFLIFATEIAWRSYLHAAPQARQLTLLAVQQFVPCLVAGGLLTYASWSMFPRPRRCSPGCGRSCSAWGSLHRAGCCRRRRSGSLGIICWQGTEA